MACCKWEAPISIFHAHISMFILVAKLQCGIFFCMYDTCHTRKETELQLRTCSLKLRVSWPTHESHQQHTTTASSQQGRPAQQSVNLDIQGAVVAGRTHTRHVGLRLTHGQHRAEAHMRAAHVLPKHPAAEPRSKQFSCCLKAEITICLLSSADKGPKF